jgi:hypothetical protein
MHPGIVKHTINITTSCSFCSTLKWKANFPKRERRVNIGETLSLSFLAELEDDADGFSWSKVCGYGTLSLTNNPDFVTLDTTENKIIIAPTEVIEARPYTYEISIITDRSDCIAS